MNLGRRQNADPRWILPLICRRGNLTKNDVGAIRIGPNETAFQVPRALAAKFQSAVAKTASPEDDVLFEVSDRPMSGGTVPPPAGARQYQRGPARSGPSRGGPARGGPRRSNDRH